MTRPTGSVGIHILVQSSGTNGQLCEERDYREKTPEQRVFPQRQRRRRCAEVSESPPELRAQSSPETPHPGQGHWCVQFSSQPSTCAAERVPANAECLPLPKEVRGFGAADQEPDISRRRFKRQQESKNSRILLKTVRHHHDRVLLRSLGMSQSIEPADAISIHDRSVLNSSAVGNRSRVTKWLRPSATQTNQPAPLAKRTSGCTSSPAPKDTETWPLKTKIDQT